MQDLPELTPAYATFEYSDPAQFRSAPHLGPTDVIPLTNKIDAKQDVLQLPGCRLCQFTTFPRMIDGRVPPNSTMIGFTMHDTATVRFNGWKRDLPSIMIGHSGNGYTLLEEGVTTFGTILFEPEITNRNWPRAYFKTVLVVTSAQAEQKLRDLFGAAFASALTSPAAFASSAHRLKEAFLAAIDDAVRATDFLETARIEAKNRHLRLMQGIDAYLVDHIAEPVYIDDIAGHIGVSVRTMHQIVVKFRGMSPHRYLRLKRLWSVRKQLLDGGHGVKDCAISHGFQHLGDFSRMYQKQFGETASQTLARK